MRYVALVHKDKNSSYGLSFPDCPGCVSAGNNFDEVVANAQEALAFHIQGLEADGDPTPPPRSIQAIQDDKSLRTVLLDAAFIQISLCRGLA